MTLKCRNSFLHFSYYKSNTIVFSSSIACACGDCLGEVRGLIVRGLTARFDCARFDCARFDRARFDYARFDCAQFDCARFDCTRFDCARFDCARFDCERFDCARFDLRGLICAVWLCSQSNTHGNAIPSVPVEVTNISTSIRHYCSEMRHCVHVNCVTHTTANYCRRRRFSGFIASNLGCLIFADVLASFFLYYILYVCNMRWLKNRPILLLSLHP